MGLMLLARVSDIVIPVLPVLHRLYTFLHRFEQFDVD